MAKRKGARDTNQPENYTVEGIIPGATVKLSVKKSRKVVTKASKK